MLLIMSNTKDFHFLEENKMRRSVMIKKYLLFLAVVVAVFSFGFASAAQIDGLQNAAGPNLPVADDGSGATDPLHVYVNPAGFGDALIYGYYNVRDNNVNYFQLVNTDTHNGKVVKVRFREAATIKDACGIGKDCGSREILDFVVCLSPGDVWTGAITGSGTGVGEVCSLDPDLSPGHPTATAPTLPACSKGGQPFATTITSSGVTITPDQTKEGYFEVLAYGNWGGSSCVVGGNNASGVAGNYMMGTNYIINDVTGATYAYKATALADWNMTTVNPQTTNAEDFNLSNGTDNYWGTSLYAVDYVLTKANVLGTYAIDPSLSAETEMAVTFPTKLLNQLEPTSLFDSPVVTYSVWDTAENTITPQAGFSPSFTPTNELPNEVNMINLFDASNDVSTTIFTSDVQGNLDATIPGSTFGLGWLGVDLTPSASCTDAMSADATVSCTRYGGLFDGGVGAGTTAEAYGLPAVGYVFQNLGGATATFPVGYTANIH
jgi:hypothetical protein